MIEKIIRNYLQIKSLNELKYKKKPNNKYIIKEVSSEDFQLNKFFYKQIGKIIIGMIDWFGMIKNG